MMIIINSLLIGFSKMLFLISRNGFMIKRKEKEKKKKRKRK